jgi:TonB-linked SusC/RagA family outer membrane protein
MARPLFWIGLFCYCPLSLLAQLAVSGTVTDADDGMPLIGVSVREVGTPNGTVTDLEGSYRLTVAEENAILSFSYVGKASREVPVNARSLIDVALSDDGQLLQQVVVTGYRGAQDVKDLVGSYNEIGTEELQADRPVASIDQLLEGRVAGVQVENVTGEPGLPIRVQIRGQSSLPTLGSEIAASTQPLYILDGVPLYDVLETNTRNSVFNTFNNQPLNPLSLLNPDDIASITVLKDASATALYGADAANGVVLITTKQGSTGDPALSLSASVGAGRTINEIQYLTTEQYLELARETALNSGLNPRVAGPADIETDWREIVRQAPRNADIDLTLNGALSGSTYRITAGYSEIESIHRRNGLQQANLGLNLTTPVGQRMQISTRVLAAYQYREGLRSFDAFSFPPNLPVRLADGSFNNAGFFDRRPNPAALLEQNEDETDSYSTNAKMTLTYEALTGLNLRLLGGIDQVSRDQYRYDSALNGSGRLRGGSLRRSENLNTQWITNGQAVYSPGGLGRHHPSVLVGGELQRQNDYRVISTGDGFLFDDQRRLADLPDGQTSITESRFVRAKASTYGELAYDYDYRYYLKLNGRRDASSLFGGDRQADLFWALGTAWNFDREAFWRGRLPLGISSGKVRASYGVTGNSRLGVYTTSGLYVVAGGDELYGGRLPYLATTPRNENLSWERKFQTNLSLDLGWRDDRLGLTAEYYSNRTVDGLFTFDTPLETGFATVLANAASLRNWGYELTLRFATPRNSRWHYSTSFNAAHNRNRLLDLSREVPIGSSGSNRRAFIIGEDVNILYGIPATTVDPQTGTQRFILPGGEMTTDVTLARDPANFVPLGRGSPTVFGGWHQQLNYGAASLTLQINYSFGSDILIDDLTFTDGRQILFNNQSVNQLDRWQQPGDVSTVPKLMRLNSPVAQSSRYLRQLNYVEFSTLNFSFDFGRIDVLPLGTARFRAFVVGNKLGYLYDERRREDRNGIAEYRFTFPEQQSLTLGVKMGW